MRGRILNCLLAGIVDGKKFIVVEAFSLWKIMIIELSDAMSTYAAELRSFIFL